MKKSDTLRHETLLDQRPEQVRRLLPRGLRRFIALVLTVLFLVSLVAVAAAIRPFAVTLPTPMFAYTQSVMPSYTVNLTPSARFGEPTLPAGRIYIRDYVESVSVRFDLAQRAVWLGSLASRTQAEALLQVYSAQDPSALLMERRTALLPAEENAPSWTAQNLSRSVTVPLAAYRETAAAFLRESGASGNAILTVRLTAELAGSRFGYGLAARQAASVVIPLSADSFQIAVSPAADRGIVTGPIRYLVQPEALPLFVYPLASALLLLALVLFLALTASRPVRHFQRELKRLLRQGRRQILMIADKAWEPEWCVTVSSFRSMVQTARRLRHPIFCYVDHDPEHPAAYFYVYYGENNYCYVFEGTVRPNQASQPVHSLAAGETAAPAGHLTAAATDNLAAPALTRATATAASRSDGTVSPAGNPAGNPAAASAAEAAPRFQTGPVKLPPVSSGTGPIPTMPSSAGPMMPSPEPFLDLIRDPWPVEPDTVEPASEAAAPKTAVPDTAAPVKMEASVKMEAPAKAEATDAAAAEPAREPVPIMPETDASFYRSSLF